MAQNSNFNNKLLSPGSTSSHSVDALFGKCLPPEMDEHSFIRTIEGSLNEICLILPGTCVNEWLATNTLGFFTLLDLITASIIEYCTLNNCPEMTAGETVYYWYDERKQKIQTPCT